MIIEFHLTGENRKALVKAISEILEISAEYQYMPTCAYKIGECYTVTKEGDLEISDSADGKEIEMLISELASRGYEIPSANKLTVQMPADFFTEHTLNNLYQICKNKAVLFQAAFKTDSLDIIQSDDKVEFPWFTVEMMVMQMPTAFSFPCSANLQKIKNASTTSLKPLIILNTQCVVIFFDWV